MFINKRKIYALWGIIAGLLIIITFQAFNNHGFVMVNGGGSMKKVGLKVSITPEEGKRAGNITGKTENSEEMPEAKDKNIRICIQGAVKTPGTILLPEKARLEDAINKAGGLLPNAAKKHLNQAEFLEDGVFVYIQTIEEERKNGFEVTTGEVTAGEVGGQKSSEKININKASEKELDSLPGVGEATAEKIVEYRKTKGPFKKIEDLKNVSGIGDGKFKKLKELIKI